MEARRTILPQALRLTLASLDPIVIDTELARYAPSDARRVLAAAGIRDELVFAVPSVISAQPTLLGYYRLLYGVSKKSFYTKATGLTRFQKLEDSNTCGEAETAGLPDVCYALNGVIGQLISTIGGSLNDSDVQQLPLITLGAQLDGSHRNKIGQTATRAVFESIKAIVNESGVDYIEVDGISIAFTNSAGRQVTVVLASDPDVVIQEEIQPTVSQLKVAIEIKGGTDRSNVHNRAGEAEKSHQKVRTSARDFWTVISLRDTSVDGLSRESPTTRQWFDVTEVIERSGQTWHDFRAQLSVALGIALPPE